MDYVEFGWMILAVDADLLFCVNERTRILYQSRQTDIFPLHSHRNYKIF